MTPKVHTKLQKNPREYEKILVFMPSWIGDAVMALPLVDQLREAFPGSRIDALARSWVAPLLESYPALDHVRSYEAHGRNRNMLSASALIRGGEYDLALLTPNSFRTALLCFLGGIKRRVGYRADGRAMLLTDPMPRDQRALFLHMVEYYLELLKPLGLEPVPSSPKLPVTEKKRLQAARIMEENGVKMSAGPLMGFLTGAQNSKAKMWHTSRFAQVADRAVREFGGGVVFFGGAGDADRVEEVRSLMQEPSCSLAGRLPLETLPAAVSHCGVFVSNDTGPMHVAAAVGTPVVAIFNSTDPRITAPYSAPCSIVQAKVPCAPCCKRKCDRDLECMNAISADDVLSAVEHQIKTAR